MSDEITTIYVRLLEEDVETARPAPAQVLGEKVYQILLPDDYDPEDEVWEFLPGDVVRCEVTKWNEKGPINLAVEKMS